MRALIVFAVLLCLGVGVCAGGRQLAMELQERERQQQREVAQATEEARKAKEDLKKYEAPYDDLLVLEDEPPQPKAACTMCCCKKTLGQCHVSCIRYKGGHNAMCSSLCAMKARGIPMPLEHGSESEREHRH